YLLFMLIYQNLLVVSEIIFNTIICSLYKKNNKNTMALSICCMLLALAINQCPVRSMNNVEAFHSGPGLSHSHTNLRSIVQHLELTTNTQRITFEGRLVSKTGRWPVRSNWMACSSSAALGLAPA